MNDFWMWILAKYYNTNSYFVEHQAYDDGNTHHNCDCLQNFTVGGQQFGTVSQQFCCNGANGANGHIWGSWRGKTADEYSSLPCNYYLQDDKTTRMSDIAHERTGAFRSLWCPIDLNSCLLHGDKLGKDDWVKDHFFEPARLKQGFEAPGVFEAGNFTAAAKAAFSKLKLSDGIYWDFCDSSFNDKLTMNEQDSDPTFAELCIRGCQAVLVCFEMCIATWLHRRVFSYKDYRARSSTRWAKITRCLQKKNTVGPWFLLQNWVFTAVFGGSTVVFGGAACGFAFPAHRPASSRR